MKSTFLNRLRFGRSGNWLGLIALTFMPTFRALALDPREKPAHYVAAHWDTEDGLPHNLVRCICQTHDGYLWVGTAQGLARFDGLNFTVFNQHNTPAFHNNIVTSMAQTSDGSLWIGTSFGLVRHHDGGFTGYGRADGIKADTVNGLCIAPDGSLWIAGREGVTRWINGKFINDIDTSAYDMLGTRFIGVTRQGDIWIATGSDALRYRDGKFVHFGREDGLPAKSLRMLSEDADGTILAVSSGGLFRLKDGHFVPFEQNDALGSPRVEMTLADHSGNLWIGSFAGLDRYAGDRLVSYTDRDGDKLSTVEAIFEDREHCLWVGTTTGLYRLTDRRISLLPLEGGTSAETMVNTLIQSRDGALWISKWVNGVDRIQNGVTTHYAAGKSSASEPVTAIFEAADGTIWFGNRGSSLYRLDGDKFTSFVYQSGVVSSRSVTVIFEDKDGEFLLGISRRGLLRFSDGKITPVPGAAEFANDTVWTIKRTRDDRLLMGTDKGLYQRNPDRTWKLVALGGRTYAVGARALLEGEDGTIWIATEGDGLVRWKNGKETAYTTSEGMLDDVLFSVLDDKHGSLWVNSARGIARIRKAEFSKIDRGDTASLNCLTFGRDDGLTSASTSGNGTLSALCLADGSILAATDKGVVVIDQERVQINTQLPPVVIESVMVDDQPMPHNLPEILVPAGAYRLEIGYSALSLVAPQKMRFRYQLEGSDPGWIEAGHERRASYTHLSPGHYTFHVLACNNDGIWNETGATLAIQIQPHFYQTKSFVVLVIVSAALVTTGIYWVRRRNAHRHLAVLESLVDERTRELKTAKEAAEKAVIAKNEFIAALKQAEVERENLHKQLLETSRQAGMAEVASNVLHNVGNVLNSVNVSASVAADIARKSKVSNLAKVVALLDEHAENLGDFFTNDPKSSQLRDYLRRLHEHLSKEKEISITELESLRRNIEHIKDIVTMQQNYARISGVKEFVKVTDLIEDSLRMNEGALKRHAVEVIRDYNDVPEINVEKHKVLQILVNLIRNAKYACDEGGKPNKSITLRVANGDERIKISVSDNGVGIPAENLTRIFNHGFTTRKTGHGFGLHSGALAAKEMGGSLRVHSGGPGHGATFVLELPEHEVEKSGLDGRSDV